MPRATPSSSRALVGLQEAMGWQLSGIRVHLCCVPLDKSLAVSVPHLLHGTGKTSPGLPVPSGVLFVPIRRGNREPLWKTWSRTQRYECTGRKANDRKVWRRIVLKTSNILLQQEKNKPFFQCFGVVGSFFIAPRPQGSWHRCPRARWVVSPEQSMSGT